MRARIGKKGSNGKNRALMGKIRSNWENKGSNGKNRAQMGKIEPDLTNRAKMRK